MGAAITRKMIHPTLSAIGAAALLAMSIAPAAAQPAALAGTAQCAARPLVVTNVLAWTGTGWLPRADVVAAGGRIVAVGRRGTLARPAGAELVDGSGATLLPGLIDSHTHFFELGGPLDNAAGLNGPDAMAPTAAATLASGVTTARVHLSSAQHGPGLAGLSESPCFAAPRLRLGGPALLGGAPTVNGNSMRGVRDAGHAAERIEALRALGARWVALHNVDRFPDDVLAALVTAARTANIRLLVAAETQAQLEIGLRIQADTLDYGLGEQPFDLTDMRRYSATTFALPLGYFRNLARLRADPRLIDDPRPLRFMTPAAADDVRARLRRFLADQPPSARELHYDRVAANFRALHRAGARMVIASDSGSPGQFHSDAIWNEMAAWNEAGIALDDVLRAATEHPAALLREPDIGRIGAGARADLLLYRGDIRRTGFDPARVDMVVKDGVVLVRGGVLARR
jgi:imidazolonepropionase-like amidohydrolase